jgi:hypothetical protein
LECLSLMLTDADQRETVHSTSLKVVSDVVFWPEAASCLIDQ